jgi:hypothetical protein
LMVADIFRVASTHNIKTLEMVKGMQSEGYLTGSVTHLNSSDPTDVLMGMERVSR